MLSGVVDGSLVAGDSVSGALGRDPGEAAGQYAITQGTLAAGPNYSITFENGVLTIAPAPQAATSGPDLQPLRATPLPAHLRSLDRRGSPVTIAPGIFCDREKPCPVR